MTSGDKAFAVLVVAVMVAISVGVAFESWADVERARHGCAEKKK